MAPDASDSWWHSKTYGNPPTACYLSLSFRSTRDDNRGTSFPLQSHPRFISSPSGCRMRTSPPYTRPCGDTRGCFREGCRNRFPLSVDISPSDLQSRQVLNLLPPNAQTLLLHRLWTRLGQLLQGLAVSPGVAWSLNILAGLSLTIHWAIFLAASLLTPSLNDPNSRLITGEHVPGFKLCVGKGTGLI